MSTVTIYSKRNEQGQAFFEECTLITGAGNVVFRAGQAQVTPEQAALITRTNPQIELRQNGGVLTAEAIAAATGPGLPVALQDASVDELDWCGLALDAYRAGVATFEQWAGSQFEPPEEATSQVLPPVETGGAADDGGELEPAPGGQGGAESLLPTTGEGDEDPAAPRPEDQKVDPSIAAAQAMLRDEGEHVPKAIPQGFEPMTGEGEPRCYARKSDGSQCTNPAKMAAADQHGDVHSSYACGLPKHVEQVAQLP